MWQSIDKEITILKDQVANDQKVNTLKDMIGGVEELFFTKGPGLLINIHRHAKNLYPINFTGINLIINKDIGGRAKYSFNLNLDPTQSQFYSSYNTYLSRECNKYFNQVNQAGFSSIIYEQDLSDEIKCSIFGHIQHIKNGTVECVLDYYGKNFTSSFAISNSDVTTNEAIVQHLHGINNQMAIGVELALQTSNGKSIDSKRLALAGRYYDKKHNGIVSATISLQGLQLCLYKKINQQLKVSSALDVCFQNKDITGSVACELVDKEFTLRSSVDTKGCVVANLLKNNFYRNGDIIFKPTISVLANIQKQVKLGIGFELLA